LKIEINIEKKHLLFFSIFIILISSFIVLGNYETFGHSANEVGPGQMAGPISVEVTQGFSGNAFSARTSSGDAIKGETYMDGKSAIYGYVSSGVNAFSGFFEGGPLVLFNQIFSILNSNGEEAYIYNDENGNMILGDEFSGDGYTLSELAQGGSSSTFLSLIDSPNDYSGNSGKVVAVKSTEDGLEFVSASGSNSGFLKCPPKKVPIYVHDSSQTYFIKYSSCLSQDGGSILTDIRICSSVSLSSCEYFKPIDCSKACKEFGYSSGDSNYIFNDQPIGYEFNYDQGWWQESSGSGQVVSRCECLY